VRPLVRLSLFTIHLVASATLIRSIIYDRWITVLASLVLLAGAAAVQRGKTWGVGVTLGAAAAFPTAWAIGIAPPWFCLVGAVGALPFLLTSRALARFDAAATALGASIAATTGLLAAVAWRAFAPLVIAHFPEFAPSAVPTNAGLAAFTTVTILSLLLTRRQDDTAELVQAVEGASFAPALPRRAALAAPTRARVADAPAAKAAFEAEDADDEAFSPAAQGSTARR
jgi:hypothetical protein